MTGVPAKGRQIQGKDVRCFMNKKHGRFLTVLSSLVKIDFQLINLSIH